MAERQLKTIRLDSVDSTNTYLKRLAESGEAEGCIVSARHQTSGRGRHGKSFYSPDGTGLYMSILLRPELSVGDAHFITPMTALAVCRAIESLCDRECKIKWVNDIYVDDKKVSGILCEGSFDYVSDRTSYVIVGIGINLKAPEGGFPNELSDIAAALEISNKEELEKRVIKELFELYDALPSRDFIKEYKERSNVIGKKLEVLGESGFFATAIDIDSECRLVVESESGEIKVLSSGEVSTKVVR